MTDYKDLTDEQILELLNKIMGMKLHEGNALVQEVLIRLMKSKIEKQ